MPGTRPTASSSACAHAVGDVIGVDRRIDQPLPAHLEGERQPAVDGDPQVAFHLGVQTVARPRSLMRVDDAVGLPVVVDCPRCRAAPDPSGPCRRRPPRRRAGAPRRSAGRPSHRRAAGRTGSARVPAGCWSPRRAAHPRPAPPPRRMRACPGSSGTSARGTPRRARRSRRCGPRRRAAGRTPRRPTPTTRCADRRGTAAVWLQP